MKRLRTLKSFQFFKYSKVKLKNQRHLAVDVLSKAYLMVPLSLQIQSGRTVPVPLKHGGDKCKVVFI
jgi:hypothetical protein